MYNIVVKPADEFSESELCAIEALVAEGGEVQNQNLRPGLRRAICLGAVFDGERIVGVGAVKHNDTHRETIACSSGIDLTLYRSEIGYVYVRPEYRGKCLAANLFEKLLSKCPEGSFATTREDNQPMQRILEKSGFTRAGKPWPSTQFHEKYISLWVGPRHDCPRE